MDKFLEIQNVTKSFGSLSILRDVDLSVAKGESIAILGPSGAGKSTLLHIAGLMEAPSTGAVYINRKNTTAQSDDERAAERLKTIGFLFQFHHLLPDFTVLENVIMPCRLAGLESEEAEKEAIDLLERLGLRDRMAHKPYQLSGGEQQRAAFARAMIRRPGLLLCDEPTGNLDERTGQEMMGLVWAEMKRGGAACIIVTHNRDLARNADRVLTLHEGRLESAAR
jgi:lipoprotein-releasing system ATP-binding protein